MRKTLISLGFLALLASPAAAHGPEVQRAVANCLGMQDCIQRVTTESGAAWLVNTCARAADGDDAADNTCWENIKRHVSLQTYRTCKRAWKTRVQSDLNACDSGLRAAKQVAQQRR